MAWVLQAAAITSAIFGTSNVNHIDEAVKSLDITLSAEEISILEAPYQPRQIIGHDQPQAARMLRRR